MIIVDTSVWVEFDRATGSRLDRHLTNLITRDGDIASTDPVLMELLAGARDEEASSRLRRLLTSFGWIPTLAPVDSEAAARIYRACRAEGYQPSGLIDCLIAAVTMRSGSTLLTGDSGFAAISQVVPLELEPVG